MRFNKSRNYYTIPENILHHWLLMDIDYQLYLFYHRVMDKGGRKSLYCGCFAQRKNTNLWIQHHTQGNSSLKLIEGKFQTSVNWLQNTERYGILIDERCSCIYGRRAMFFLPAKAKSFLTDRNSMLFLKPQFKAKNGILFRFYSVHCSN